MWFLKKKQGEWEHPMNYELIWESKTQAKKGSVIWTTILHDKSTNLLNYPKIMLGLIAWFYLCSQWFFKQVDTKTRICIKYTIIFN